MSRMSADAITLRWLNASNGRRCLGLKAGDCPPESGGQRDREADPARGGSQASNLKGFRLWNHPGASRHPKLFDGCARGLAFAAAHDSGGEFTPLNSNRDPTPHYRLSGNSLVRLQYPHYDQISFATNDPPTGARSVGIRRGSCRVPASNVRSSSRISERRDHTNHTQGLRAGRFGGRRHAVPRAHAAGS